MAGGGRRAAAYVTPWGVRADDPERRLLPERDILDTLHYESCAVVGNGGLLLVYEHGDIIDSHDAVIRFNDATTRAPYAKHAGSKTTIRLVNSQHRGTGMGNWGMGREGSGGGGGGGGVQGGGERGGVGVGGRASRQGLGLVGN